jgi:hypothetical protein
MKKQDPAYRFAAFFLACDMKYILIVFIAFTFFIVGCNSGSDTKVERSTNDTIKSIDHNLDSLLKEKTIQDSIQLTHRKDSILLKLTQNILLTLKNKNYSAFANYIDPVSGLRFSPYGFVDTVHHIKLSKRAFITLANNADANMLIWGQFDGTEDTIRMTLNNYMHRFVYDVDFAKPEKREVNNFIGAGNSLNNLLSVYKDCDFTESHFSGFEEKYKGMDWKSLRLVFKERNKRYYLVGIIHDEWTI